MEKYKTTLRLPTDQFAFIELSVEETPEGAMEIYKRLKNAVNGNISPNNPIPTMNYLIELFNSDLDPVFWKKMSPDQYAQLSEVEQQLIQSVKRFYKRLPKEEVINIK